MPVSLPPCGLPLEKLTNSRRSSVRALRSALASIEHLHHLVLLLRDGPMQSALLATATPDIDVGSGPNQRLDREYFPARTAVMSGVSPVEVATFTSAPALIRRCTASRFAFSLASAIGVTP